MLQAGHVPGAINAPVLNKAGWGMAENPAFLEQVRHVCSFFMFLLRGGWEACMQVEIA